MRETIGSTWIYQLVIVFILIFVAFLILSLTYSKNYKTRNELINIIEKYEGFNDKSISIINNYLKYNGYHVKGGCPIGELWYGVNDLESTDYRTSITKSTQGVKYYYCINKKYSSKKASDDDDNKEFKNKSKMIYQIRIFFKFNLPVLGSISTFTVDGTTNDIYRNTDFFDEVSARGV